MTVDHTSPRRASGRSGMTSAARSMPIMERFSKAMTSFTFSWKASDVGSQLYPASRLSSQKAAW